MHRARTLILGLAALALASVVVLVWLRGNKASEAAAPAPATTATPARPVPSAPDDASRSLVAPDGAAAPAALPPAVSGSVVDPAGSPVPDVAVSVVDEEAAEGSTARSGPDGGFQLALESLPAYLAVAEPGWTTLELGVVREDAPHEPARIVAARATRLAGIVVDRGEHPIPGARLMATVDAAAQPPVPRGKWGTSSGLDGRFVLEKTPALERVHVRTWLQGWRADERTLDLSAADAAGQELHIVLDPDDPTGPVLEGKVVHADGSPARGALVALGAARARTGAEGAFRLACTWFDRDTPLVACERGFQPAILPGYGARIDPLARSLPSETIVLPGKELEIEGRVVFKNGAPCKGWRVAIEDGTPLDPLGTSRDVAEEEVSGHPEVKTDSRGTFHVTGLTARSYTLLATGRNAFVRAEVAVRSDPTPAGSRGLVLVAPDGNPGEVVRGRILTQAGAPAVGVLVGLGRPVLAGSPAQFAWQGRFRTVSGADGSFELQSVPACLGYIVASSDVILPARLALDPGASRSNLEIRVQARRAFSFDASTASPRPDRLLARTLAGAPTPIWTVDTLAPIPSGIAILTDGRSASLAVGEDAHELVIYRGCVELGRIPVPGTEGVRLSWP